MGKNRRQERLRQRRQQEATSAPAAREARPARAARASVSAKPPWRETLDSWGGFPVAGAILGAVVVVAIMVWLNRPGSSAGSEPYQPVERVQVNGRIEGDPNAPVKIIEFADFQCPFCKRFTNETAPALMEEFIQTGIVSLEFRHFAFIGPDSIRAAEASECAADQNLFWPYHDVLFLRQGQENSGVYSASNLKRYAREVQEAHAEFDVAAFDSCLDSGAKRAVVEEMTRQANSLGVQSTPSFLVNGQPLTGVRPIEAFREVIAQVQGQ